MSEDNRMSATTAKVQRDEAMRQLERLRAATEIELRDAQQVLKDDYVELLAIASACWQWLDVNGWEPKGH